jgi:serine/threonine protein phosphatase 1
MRRFVIGDIHGASIALKQCLERSDFDYRNDHLIALGDVCDGWPETREAIDELLKIKNLTYILGNHDFWTLEWMKYGMAEDVWLDQGGMATLRSYNHTPDPVHMNFLDEALPFFQLDDKLFVHAGFDPLRPIEQQGIQTFLWDRNLSRIALDLYSKGIHSRLTGYDEVYIGHTPVPFGMPIHTGGVWLMDIGAGWSGVLSMMDIDTKDMYISDPVPTLYPGVEGRKRK